jgi:hypothetical protein
MKPWTDGVLNRLGYKRSKYEHYQITGMDLCVFFAVVVGTVLMCYAVASYVIDLFCQGAC